MANIVNNLKRKEKSLESLESLNGQLKMNLTTNIQNVDQTVKKMTWDEYFFDLISCIKNKSKDNSTKIGCVIVSEDNEILSTGFNGFPRGVIDNISARYQRETKLFLTEHSERNSIYAAAKRGTSLNGSKIYVNGYPCAECMRAIIQSGIKEVVIKDNSKEFNERWKTSIEWAIIMAKEANIKIRIWQHV